MFFDPGSFTEGTSLERQRLKALRVGVEYFKGASAIPGPLRALLTDTRLTRAHVTFEWARPISTLDEQIAELTKRITSHLKAVAVLIGEAVTD